MASSPYISPRVTIRVESVEVGGGARKTNKDYTAGTLPQLVDIIIEEKAALFICAVGVPPKWAVDKFHAAGIPVGRRDRLRNRAFKP